MKYNIENLTKEQLMVISRGCEFYSRFLAGQWRIPDILEFQEYDNQGKPDDFWGRRDDAEELLHQAKELLMKQHRNASYGIGNTVKQSSDAQTAYDIYRPILEQFAKEYNEEHPDKVTWSVYDSPGLTYSKDGRITINVINEK